MRTFHLAHVFVIVATFTGGCKSNETEMQYNIHPGVNHRKNLDGSTSSPRKLGSIVVIESNPWKVDYTRKLGSVPLRVVEYTNSTIPLTIFANRLHFKSTIRVISYDRLILSKDLETIGINISGIDANNLRPIITQNLKSHGVVVYNGAKGIPLELVASIRDSGASDVSLVLDDYAGVASDLERIGSIQDRISLLHFTYPPMLSENMSKSERAHQLDRNYRLITTLAKVPHIKYLSLSSDGLPGDTVSIFHILKSRLVYFQAMSTFCEDRCFKVISNFGALREVQLMTRMLRKRHLISLSQLKHVRKLAVRFRRAEHVSAKDLRAFRNLEHLELLSDHATDLNMAALCGVPRLLSLEISGTDIGDESMNHLYCLSELRNLNVSYTNVGKQGLADFSRFNKLRSLDISGTTALSLLRTSCCPKSVIRLRAKRTNLSGKGLALLAGKMKLQALNIADNPALGGHLHSLLPLRSTLSALALDENRIYTADLRYITRLVSLRWLSMRNAKVAKAAADKLPRNHNIEFINYIGVSNTTKSDTQYINSLKHAVKVLSD